MFPIIVVSPLELIRTQQVARLTANGINSVSLECCEISDIEEKEIVFGSTEHWLSEKWRNELRSDGSLKEAQVLVVDEVHTVETW